MKKVILSIVVASLLFMPFSAAFSSYGLDLQVTQLGNYTFTYNSSANTIYNLTYVGLNTDLKIATSVNATGNIPRSPSLPIKDASRYLSLDGVVLYSSGDLDMLLMATQGPSASITYNLVNPAQNVSLSLNFMGHSSGQGNAYSKEYGSHYIYRVTDSGYVGYIFANVNATASNGGKTLTFYEQSNTVLIVGLASHAGIEYMLERYTNQHKMPSFVYNNVTGEVTGMYASFVFDSSSGYISNFQRTGSGTNVFDTIYATGNGSFGSGDLSPIFPLIQPILVGSVFLYANSTAIYSIHNNPAMQSSFYVSNGMLHFKTNSTLTLTQYNTTSEPAFYDYNYSFNYDYLHNFSFGSSSRGYHYYNYSYYNNESLGLDGLIHSGYAAILLNRDGFIGMMIIYGGNVSISGNNITVSSPGTAKVTFISPPGTLNLSKDVSASFMYALKNGKIAAQFSIGIWGGNTTNMSFNYNNSVQIRLMSASPGNATLQVSSMFSEGTNFAIYVPSSIISNNTSKVSLAVKLDGKNIQSTSFDSLINSTSSSTAYYHAFKVQGGTMFLIHIPSFSIHNITLSTGTVSPPGVSPIVLLAIGLAIAIILAIIGFYAFKRREKV